MNEAQAKNIGKFIVNLTSLIDAWEEQSRRVQELQRMVGLICVGLQRGLTADERKLIVDYGEAYYEQTETGSPAENNPGSGE